MGWNARAPQEPVWEELKCEQTWCADDDIIQEFYLSAPPRNPRYSTSTPDKETMTMRKCHLTPTMTPENENRPSLPMVVAVQGDGVPVSAAVCTSTTANATAARAKTRSENRPRRPVPRRAG